MIPLPYSQNVNVIKKEQPMAISVIRVQDNVYVKKINGMDTVVKNPNVCEKISNNQSAQ